MLVNFKMSFSVLSSLSLCHVTSWIIRVIFSIHNNSWHGGMLNFSALSAQPSTVFSPYFSSPNVASEASVLLLQRKSWHWPGVSHDPHLLVAFERWLKDFREVPMIQIHLNPPVKWFLCHNSSWQQSRIFRKNAFWRNSLSMVSCWDRHSADEKAHHHKAIQPCNFHPTNHFKNKSNCRFNSSNPRGVDGYL